MTIKQLGGVFGRNPTFNDVTIEGELTFDGDIDINSDLTVDGNLLVKGTTTSENSVIVTGGITGHGANRTTLSQEGGGAGYWQSYGADVATKGLFVLRQASSDFSVNNIPLAIFPSGGANFGGYVDAGAGNVRIANGNLVIGTSGKGIDFSATAGTGTSELLDDYEEGTWTATPTFASGTGTGAISGRYTKVGDLVCATVNMGGNIGTGSGAFTITGLPFACGLSTAASIRTAGIGATGTVLQANVVSGGTTIGFLLAPQSTSLAGAVPTTAQMNSPDFYIQLSVSYHV